MGEGKDCCYKAESKAFKIMLFGKMIAVLLIILIMWFIYSYQFFAPKLTSDVSHGFAATFFACYFIFLVINTITVSCRHSRKKNCCSRTNCGFIWVMLTIFAVTLGVGIKLATKRTEMKADLSQDCNGTFREDNPSSLLARLDEVSIRSQKLLCSAKCRCIMSRIITGDLQANSSYSSLS